MAKFFRVLEPDESQVMTGAQFAAAFSLDVSAQAVPIAAGDVVRVSRIVSSSEFRSSTPPTAYAQGNFNGGSIYVFEKPFATWDWMHNAEDVFDGAVDNVRQSYSSTGQVMAVLVGATDPAGALLRFAIV